MHKLVPSWLLFVLVLGAVAVQPAHAYIDPNSGGMLFQVLAGLFASLAAVLLFFSRQIRRIFARLLRTLREALLRRTQAPAEPPPPSTLDNALAHEATRPANHTTETTGAVPPSQQSGSGS